MGPETALPSAVTKRRHPGRVRGGRIPGAYPGEERTESQVSRRKTPVPACTCGGHLGASHGPNGLQPDYTDPRHSVGCPLFPDPATYPHPAWAAMVKVAQETGWPKQYPLDFWRHDFDCLANYPVQEPFWWVLYENGSYLYPATAVDGDRHRTQPLAVVLWDKCTSGYYSSGPRRAFWWDGRTFRESNRIGEHDERLLRWETVLEGIWYAVQSDRLRKCMCGASPSEHEWKAGAYGRCDGRHRYEGKCPCVRYTPERVEVSA